MGLIACVRINYILLVEFLMGYSLTVPGTRCQLKFQILGVGFRALGFKAEGLGSTIKNQGPRVKGLG